MNLPGSVIGACRRAEFAGIVTHSLMPATVSSTSGPPSRNARVLLGTSAAASSAARVTPRRVRDGRDAGLKIGDAVALEDAEPRGLAVGGEAHELHG